MATINSVLGPISPDKLGLTLAHEHLVAGYPGWECDALSTPYDRDKIVKICVKALEPVKQFGVKSMVDATAIDMSRDVDVMKGVSEKLQINIICSTGMYLEGTGNWSYFRARGRVSDLVAELCETYVHDITKGIRNTGVKAGVIKVATGTGKIAPCEMASLKAAARAQKETGVPIITHQDPASMGPEQVDVMLSEGANPAKIMCGHMCSSPSMKYQFDVLQKGVNIGFDQFSQEMILPDSVRIAVLIGLLSAGYEKRILLSQDYASYLLGRVNQLPPEYSGLASYTYLFAHIIPALKKAGITDQQINTMMVENPQRLFA